MSETRKAVNFYSEAGYRERGLCPVRLAYRTMADIGSQARCGAKAATAAGFCRRHDPETAPKRDKQGRIMPAVKPAPRIVAECGSCKYIPGSFQDSAAYVDHFKATGSMWLPMDHDTAMRHRSLGHDVREVKETR